MTKIYFNVLAALLLTISLKAQNDPKGVLKMAKDLDFLAADSLRGFDERNVSAAALTDGFFGSEYHVYLYRAKRSFINSKYNLIPSTKKVKGAGQPMIYGKAPGGGGGNVINAAPCVNEDFELNNFSGWVITSGQNNNTCAYNTCPTAGSSEAWIRTTPWADANFPGGFLSNSPLGGTRVAQLNNNGATGLVTRISQTFPVTGANALFQFAYAAVFNPAHSCCQQPFLNIYVKDCNNQILACPQISVVSPGPSCVSPAPGFSVVGANSVCNWQLRSIDLSQYINSCVTIEVTVGDCSGWAHYGYVYFDAVCGPLNLVVNGVTFPAGTNATTVSACGGVNSATITAPPGLAPYNWNGPPGSGIVNNNNQTIIGTVGGQYTLTMNPPGSCAPINKLVTLLFAPTPTAGLTASNMCNIFTFTNTGNPAPSVQTYSFAGPAGVPGFTTTSTSTTVTFPVPGVYTVTQVMTNTALCTATAVLTITVPVAPNVGFSINTPTQCLTGNSYIFTAADPSGVHGYSFSPGAGAPAPGNTPTYGPVQFTLPGTYTVTHTMTAGGCTTFSNAIVVINPQPVATATNNGPVCLNTPLILNAGGGNTYAWSGPLGFTSAVQNPTLNNATLGMSGVYTVIVTSTAGCTSTAVTNASVYSLPSPTITSNSPVCFGGVLTLTASGGSNYVWTGPNAFTSNLTTPVINNVTLPANGIYTLMAGAGNCTVITTASITINPLPNVNANSNSPVCLNQQLNLNAGGASTYTWAGPNGYSAVGQNQTIAGVQNSNAGIYTVTATNVNSCVNYTTINVVVNPLPVLATNNPTNCPGTQIQIISSGANTYAWTGPLGFTSNLQNPFIMNAQVPMSGAYVVIGTSAQGCTSTAVSNVSVSPSPTAVIVHNSPVCFGGSLTLNGSGGATYSWSGPNGFNMIATSTVINNVTLPANGIYTLIVTVNTCTSLAVADITINPLPNPVIQMSSPICEGDPITFTGFGGMLYQWAGPGNFTGTGVNPVIQQAGQIHTGVYTVTTTDINGCVNSATAAAQVNTLPVVAALGSTVCLGNTAALSVTGAGVYSWTGPNNFSSTQASFTFPNFSESQAGIYYVTVTGANQCTIMTAGTVTNWPTPTPIASNNGPVCLNEKVEFTGDGGYLYQWRGPNGFIADTKNTTLLSANSKDYSGTYTLGVTDSKGCQGFTTTFLLVRALPTATVVSGSKNNCVPFCSTFNLASTSSLQTTYWSLNDGGMTGGASYSSCFNKVGSYVLKSKFADNYGCVSNNSFVINAYPIPVADFHYGPGAPKEKDQLDFKDASEGDAINGWSWYFNANNAISFQQNPSYIFEDPGTYAVAMIVSNKWGCKDTIVKPIFVEEDFNVFVPNAFTPNGDGINDSFQPKGYGVASYNIRIFDRWGEKLFETSEFANAWDGKFKGELAKYDTYIWKIVIKNKEGKLKELSGTVTLVN